MSDPIGLLLVFVGGWLALALTEFTAVLLTLPPRETPAVAPLSATHVAMFAEFQQALALLPDTIAAEVKAALAAGLAARPVETPVPEAGEGTAVVPEAGVETAEQPSAVKSAG